MKKLLFAFALILGASTTFAESVEQGAITYQINFAKKTASVEQLMFDKVKEETYAMPSTFMYEDEEYIVTGIGDKAFRNGVNNKVCTKLIIPESVKTIGASAFLYCKYLKEIVLPSQISVINGSTFAQCQALEIITIPEGVTEIGNNAFKGCQALKTIVIPSSVRNIYATAFEETSIKELILPEGMTKIYNQAFSRMTKLQKIQIPSTVTEIESSAFVGCERLSEINLPNITTVESRTFAGCASLESITLPESVTSLAATAFQNCAGLVQITLPSSLTSIGREAFKECYNLKTIYCNAAIPPTLQIEPFTCSGFIGCGGQIMEGATVYVPKGCAERYKNATNKPTMTQGWESLNIVETNVEPTLPATISQTLTRDHNRITAPHWNGDMAVIQSKYISVYDAYSQEQGNVGKILDLVNVQTFIKQITEIQNPAIVKPLAKELKSAKTPDALLQVFLKYAALLNRQS